MSDRKTARTARSPAAQGKRMGKVAVLFGGRSAEREISLLSGSMVLAALNRQGVLAFAFDPAERPLGELVTHGFERAFVALHGRWGEDGTVQGALEVFGIPYTGPGVMASAVAMDKIMSKRIWHSVGLPVPDHVLLTENVQPADVIARLGLPLIIKPIREGSTLGLTRVERASQFRTAWKAAALHDDAVMAESFVAGRELTVAVLGSGKSASALPVIEIRAPQGNYNYQNKYFSDETEYLCPAPLPAKLTKQVQALALDAYRELACTGWARVDLMMDAQLRPYLLEINTSPGLTGHSLVPMAARAQGIDFDSLVMKLLADASLKVSERGAVVGRRP